MKTGIGGRLRFIRNEESQKEFGARFGVNLNTVGRYESGATSPTGEFIASVCQEFGLNPSWMIFGEEPMYRDGRETTAMGPSPLTAPVAPKDQDPFDAIGMAEGMGLLAEIYSSGDNIYIRAINANLMAFSDAVKTKTEAVVMKETIRQMQMEILKMREQFNELKQEVLALRNENSELKRVLRAKDGNDCEVATG